MIKSFFSIIMATLFLLIGSQQALVVLRFKLNQETIEKQFCENKNRPQLRCHGTCHLKKELKQTENKNIELKNNYKNFDLALVAKLELVCMAPNWVPLFRKIAYRECKHTEPYLDVFVPPPVFYLH